jgi:hypothetical protein
VLPSLGFPAWITPRLPYNFTHEVDYTLYTTMPVSQGLKTDFDGLRQPDAPVASIKANFVARGYCAKLNPPAR